jgi:hypothetical protein
MEEPRSTPGGRLLLAFEMADLGIALMRENLRRRHPEMSCAELDERMAEWLAGPSPVDVDLRVVPWPK